ncbi:MAG: Ribbon-helix-helix protein copG family [Vampirovibrio sp.]|jgi:metal-responsive CopG/Arc/MetJ family transcriptional regulator|nr:Ribbon-helix-helix protein copG family [Vampirovibrio sp.]
MARVLISMKDEFLKRIDEVAEREQRSRSELIREALRTYIRRNTATSATPPSSPTES